MFWEIQYIKICQDNSLLLQITNHWLGSLIIYSKKRDLFLFFLVFFGFLKDCWLQLQSFNHFLILKKKKNHVTNAESWGRLNPVNQHSWWKKLSCLYDSARGGQWTQASPYHQDGPYSSRTEWQKGWAFYF